MTFDPTHDATAHPDESMQAAALRLVREALAALKNPDGVLYMLADEEDLVDSAAVIDALDGALYYLEQTVPEPEPEEDAAPDEICGTCGDLRDECTGDRFDPERGDLKP